jgi:hypothetical protein
MRNFSANDDRPSRLLSESSVFSASTTNFSSDCPVKEKTKNAKEPNYLAVKLAGKSFKELTTLGTICRYGGGEYFHGRTTQRSATHFRSNINPP